MGKAGPGYRKPKTKKYFTKKDIISTSIVVAIVLIVVIVLGVVISRDDFIRVVDGKLEMEDNWLISNYSDTSRYMYYKVGEIGEIEGYTLGAGSAQSLIKVITADDEDALVSNIYLGTFEHNYITAAESMAEYYAETDGPYDVTIAGRSAKYITSYSKASDETAEETEAVAEDTEVVTEDAEVVTEDAEAVTEDAEAVTEDTEAVAEDTESDGVAVDSASEDIWVLVAYVDYDEDHCIYVQLNSDQELTTEQAESYLAMVSDQLTLVER